MSNKYDTTWGQLRRRHGLQWCGNRPGIDDFPSAKTALIIALACFAMISLIAAVQYQNEAVQAVNLAEKRANQLGECIQGKARFITGDGKAIVCRKAEEFKI